MLLGLWIGVVATLARGSFAGQALAEAGGRSGRRRTERETDGEAKADRLHRRVGGIGAALGVARAGRVREDPPAGSLRQPRGRKITPDRHAADDAPPQDRQIRERGHARLVRTRAGRREKHFSPGGTPPHPGPKDRASPMRDNQIATVCYVRFGRRPHGTGP